MKIKYFTKRSQRNSLITLSRSVLSIGAFCIALMSTFGLAAQTCEFVNNDPVTTDCSQSNGVAFVSLNNIDGPSLTATVPCDNFYTYFWQDDENPGAVIGNTAMLSNLTPGSYTVTVCDEGMNTASAVYNGIAFNVPDDCVVIYSGTSTVTNGCTFGYGGDGAFGIEDPCSCNNDQTANGSNDGTFSEIVEVTGPVGSNVVVGTAMGVPGVVDGTPSTGLRNLANMDFPFNTPFTETSPGVFQLSGSHVDGVGYTIYVMIEDGGTFSPALDVNGDQIFVSNVCEYPEVSAPLSSAGFCSDALTTVVPVSTTDDSGNPITLVDVTINGDNTIPHGTSTFTIDPSSYAPGSYSIVLDFEGTFVDDNGGTVMDPAFPGCETQYISELVIAGGENISCNNHVNVTIGPDCTINLVASMFINGGASDDLYTITYAQEDDTPILEADLAQWIGTRIKYSVADICTGISCWGYLTLEDKTAPSFPECNLPNNFMVDTTITCEAYLNGADIRFPIVLGATCDAQLDSTLVSDTLGLACQFGYAAIIRQQYTVVDQFNNVATCFRNINVEKKDVIDIEFPADTIIRQSEAPNQTCDIFDMDFLTPDITGEPSCLDCPNLQYHYTDVFVPLDCDTEKKFVRTWLVVDWCTGETREEGQLIETLDDVPVIFTCGETCFTILTDPGKCTASYTFPVPVNLREGLPTAQDVTYSDCSEVTFTISYSVVPEDLIGVDITDPCSEQFIPTTPLVFTEVLPNANGEYIVEDLPIGLAWFKYDLRDACGNVHSESACTKDVIIRDGNPPTAWCEGFDVVPLDSDGYAVVLAESVDDNSEDLCGGDLTFQVRRIDGTCPGHADDAQFGPDVHLCCEDLAGGTVAVELLVTDEDGNTSTCVGQLTPTFDPGPIVIDCPDDVTVECGDDFTDINIIGGPTLVSTGIDPTCFATSIEIRNENFNTNGLNECGYGTVIRTFNVFDVISGTVISSCSQTITVTDDGGLLESEITWPAAEITVNACGNDVNTSPTALDSEPTVNSAADCILLAITKEDGPIMYPSPGASYCASFIRTWFVTDWCTVTNSNPTGITFTFEQRIYLNDSSSPVFTSDCDNITVTANGNECEAFVPLIVFVEDECDDFSDLLISWYIDVDNDNTGSDLSGTGPDASGTYPAGTHKITFTAIDGCGNESDMCMFTFTVIGDQNPTPICYADIIWSMGAHGTTEVWASDFDIKSINGCGSDNGLIFSFTPDGNTPALTFTCDDIPNNIGVSIPLEVFVIDAATGVYESCVVVLELQDNQNACPDSPGAGTRLSGKVMSPTHDGVSDFEVMLENMDDNDMDMEMTATDGSYAFEAVSFYNEYHVEPYKNNDPLNGVSTLDLVFIQRHILGLTTLDTPFKLIAADINKSEDVSAIDLIELRKLILGIYNEFPNNHSWNFIPDSHTFADQDQPWDYPKGIHFNALYTSHDDLDFIAVKVGDVNGSANYFNGNIQTENRSADAQFVISELERTDNNVEFALSSNEDIQLLGTQFTLKFDASALEFKGIESGAIAIADYNISTVMADEGYLTISYDNVMIDQIRKDEILLNLSFETRYGSNNYRFEINSDITEAEVYTAGDEIKGIELIDGTLQEHGGSFEVFQNQPNPFGDWTTIAYYTPESGEVNLEIMNASGALIYVQNRIAEAGYNSFRVNTDDLSASGVLLYRVQSGSQIITKKMIVVK